MSKRFTETEKWKDEWFLELSKEDKLVWIYLCENCTNAGRWKKTFKHMNFCCDCNHTEETLAKDFGDRLIDKGGYYFIPKYLKIQYPKGLNSAKPAVLAVKNEIVEYDLISIVIKSFGNDYLIIKDTDTYTDKVKDTEKDKGRIGVVRGLIKPTPQEVTDYAKSIGFELDGQYFCDKNDSIGWVVGKNQTPMKDWKGAVRTWKTNNSKYEKENKPQERIKTTRIAKLTCSSCNTTINTSIHVNQDVCGLTCKECGRKALQEIL